MQHYLRSTRDVLRTLDCHKAELDVVLGNEACDLDSAVAALVYGFYLQSKRGVSLNHIFSAFVYLALAVSPCCMFLLWRTFHFHSNPPALIASLCHPILLYAHGLLLCPLAFYVQIQSYNPKIR